MLAENKRPIVVEAAANRQNERAQQFVSDEPDLWLAFCHLLVMVSPIGRGFYTSNNPPSVSYTYIPNSGFQSVAAALNK